MGLESPPKLTLNPYDSWLLSRYEHLQSYIDEAVYRWNTRKASQLERFENMFDKSIGLIVTWNELRLCEVV